MLACMSSNSRRVVVAGGGVAALEAVLSLLELAPQLAVELIAPEDRFVNRPLSVLQPFATGGVRTMPLSRLADRGVRVLQARVERVDPAHCHVELAGGDIRPYDALVVALGARPRRAFEHALTFRGPQDAEALTGLVQDIEDGITRSVGFVAPSGVTWMVPLYELALQTAARARRSSLAVDLRFATPEAMPLEVFGRTGSALASCLLEEGHIEVTSGVAPAVPEPGRLVVAGAGEHRLDRIVALPRLEGRPLPGLPADGQGFLPVDDAGRVRGLNAVYAAGDGTALPLKQGGLAAQQADDAVAALLSDLGIAAEPPAPAERQLRAMLLTGDETWYLRRGIGDADAEVSRRPLWWPPSKLAGRRLAPFLEAEGQCGTRPSAVRRRAAIVRRTDGRARVRRLGQR
jgi:sulfide:quinone oxidoreductase